MIYKMVHYTEFYEQLSQCPITQINTILDVELIRDFYFTIIDKYSLGYDKISILNDLDKDSCLVISCNRTKLFYLKFITKLDDYELCREYNKYSFYNISEFDKLMNNYKNFIDNNDTSFLEYWYKGTDDDSNRYFKHIKDRNIILKDAMIYI